MMRLFTLAISLIYTSVVTAQSANFKPSIATSRYHQKIDELQQKILSRQQGSYDYIKVLKDDLIKQQINTLLTDTINLIQETIEKSKVLDQREKTITLQGTADVLINFSKGLNYRTLHWSQFPSMATNFSQAMRLELQRQSILPLVENLNYQAGSWIVNNIAFSANTGIAAAKENNVLTHMRETPSAIMHELSKKPDAVFADSLIASVAKKFPEQVFSYAQARNTAIGRKIAANGDSLVQTIVTLSKGNKGQMYFPFLDLLAHKKITREEIDKVLSNQQAYYKLLVQTQINYTRRLAQGDTPVAAKGLQRMLKNKSMELYVNVINGLHEKPAAVRFRSIQQLKPEELYFLIVLNEQEIYTSSYLYVYKRIFDVMPERSSDTLLHRVAYDRYKKFLTMASNYNQLDDFLGKMSAESSDKLMTDFVNNLDNGTGADDKEDAVDVANAYAAITQPNLKKIMLDQVVKNLDERLAAGNKKGTVIYRLEKLIMQSSDNSEINLGDSLGILPIYDVPNPFFKDTAGRIVLQMFFYGDADGKQWFANLLPQYSDRSKWAMIQTPYWVQYTSKNTVVPFIIFVNKPLDEKGDKDEEAQHQLIDYMDENGYEPSITVHRGHSYFLKYTIQKMNPATKVIVLGSCGAYQNLADVLKICPEAYIISSKQVGTGAINVRLYQYLQENLQNGEHINWPAMMKNIGNSFGGNAQNGFDDYVFPHQNLGAIFIKAYDKSFADTPSE